jgi:hypothetical protein
MGRKGPDGKDLPPLDDEATEGATRRMPKRSIRDRIASADDSAEETVTGDPADVTAVTAPEQEEGNYAETQLAGGTAPILRVDEDTVDIAEPAPTDVEESAPAYAGDTVEQSSDTPGPQDKAPDPVDPVDPEITQVYRPKGKSQTEEGDAADTAGSGMSSDPVCGWLVVVDGPGRGAGVTIGYGNNRVGRDRGEDIVLDFGDGQISRENHAIVTYDGKNRRFYVQQGGGRNLTHVNDELVLTPVEMTGGEMLQMGDTKLKFVPLCGPDFDWYDE